MTAEVEEMTSSFYWKCHQVHMTGTRGTWCNNVITALWLPSAMVARLASIAEWHQKVAGSSPAVVIFIAFSNFVILLASATQDGVNGTRIS